MTCEDTVCNSEISEIPIGIRLYTQYKTKHVTTAPKASVVSLSKKLYNHPSVLVGSRNGFELDLHT